MTSGCFPPTERSRVFAALRATLGLGSVAGQLLGGVLVGADLLGLGGQTVFLVNVAIGLGLLAAAIAFLPPHPGHAQSQLDVLGVVLAVLAMSSLLVPLNLWRSEGWNWHLLALLSASPVTAVALVIWEQHLSRRGSCQAG